MPTKRKRTEPSNTSTTTSTSNSALSPPTSTVRRSKRRKCNEEEESTTTTTTATTTTSTLRPPAVSIANRRADNSFSPLQAQNGRSLQNAAESGDEEPPSPDVRSQDWNPKRKLDHVKDRLKYYRSQLEYCEKQTKKYDVDLTQYDDKIHDLEEQILGIQSRIQNASNKVTLSSYIGYDVQESMRLLEEHASEFQSPPIGPIAFYLEVIDNKFGPAAEHCLEPLLKHYIVSSEEDKTTLRRIFQEIDLEAPDAIVLPARAQKKRYNMRRRVGERFVTLADVLTLHEAHVKDSALSEKDVQQAIFSLLNEHKEVLSNNTILVRSPQTAAQIMRAPPQGIIKCCTFDGTIFLSEKKQHAWGKSPHLWIDDVSSAKTLKSRIPQLRADISRLKEQQKGINKTKNTTIKRMAVIRSKMTEKRRILPALRESAREYEQNRPPATTLRIMARAGPPRGHGDQAMDEDDPAMGLFHIMIDLPTGGWNDEDDEDTLERIALNPMMALLHLIVISGMLGGEEQHGISQDTIEKHSTKIKLTDISEQLPVNCRDCRICLSDFVVDEEVRKLECGHYYHVSCVDQWLTERSAQCPLCRSNVAAGDSDSQEQAAADAEARNGQ